jgi:orotidine-5'-phosphate decarboxylase
MSSQQTSSALPPVFVALDMNEGAVSPLLGTLEGLNVGYKIGMELFYQSGADLVRRMAQDHEIFLDLKLHDIPNTVQSAAARIADMGVRVTTVHAAGGGAMLAGLPALERDDFQFLAVTVLTSMKAEDLRGLGVSDDNPQNRVQHLFNLARDNGITGFICSPLEVEGLHAELPSGTFITPGVRPAGASLDDQNRVATPLQAKQSGATSLVIGRPITRAPDPRAAAQAILDTLSHG